MEEREVIDTSGIIFSNEKIMTNNKNQCIIIQDLIRTYITSVMFKVMIIGLIFWVHIIITK